MAKNGFSGWSEKKVQQLKHDGNIRGYKSAPNKGNSRDRKHKIEAQQGVQSVHHSKEKEWLSWNLSFWANENAVEIVQEHRFDEKRMWRFDWAFPAYKIAVEYEGGIFSQYQGRKSGHHTAKHYTKDTDKYNRAQALGWRVIRVTAMNYKTVLQTLNEYDKRI